MLNICILESAVWWEMGDFGYHLVLYCLDKYLFKKSFFSTRSVPGTLLKTGNTIIRKQAPPLLSWNLKSLANLGEDTI